MFKLIKPFPYKILKNSNLVYLKLLTFNKFHDSESVEIDLYLEYLFKCLACNGLNVHILKLL